MPRKLHVDCSLNGKSDSEHNMVNNAGMLRAMARDVQVFAVRSELEATTAKPLGHCRFASDRRALGISRPHRKARASQSRVP